MSAIRKKPGGRRQRDREEIGTNFKVSEKGTPTATGPVGMQRRAGQHSARMYTSIRNDTQASPLFRNTCVPPAISSRRSSRHLKRTHPRIPEHLREIRRKVDATRVGTLFRSYLDRCCSSDTFVRSFCGPLISSRASLTPN